MPLISEEEYASRPEFGMQPIGHPEGLTVTRHPFTPPPSDGGRPWADMLGQDGKGTPTSGQMWRSAFEQENEVVAVARRLSEARDFGAPDPEHNPLDAIKGTPVEPYRDAFLRSRNGAETQAIKARIDRELENRRILEASGWSGVGAQMVAGVLSPTTLLPFGTIARGYNMGRAAVQSGLRAALWGAAGIGVQETALHSVQETRTLTESALAVGGGFVLAGLLGAGASAFKSHQLARASQAIDRDLAVVRKLREEAPLGKFNPDEAPFGRPSGGGGAADVGAAAARPIQDNRVAGAFGLEKAFRRFNPLSRLIGSENRIARDAATRIADMPMMLEQNKLGIPTGPEGGSVESRIKVDGDTALYRMQEHLHQGFSEHRFQDPNAWFTKSRAWIEGRGANKLSYHEFKEEVTRALRHETKDDGIQHSIPEVKVAAEAIRRDLFNYARDQAIEVGVLPKDADFLAGYVTRRYDVPKILQERGRFQGILVDWLQKGQIKARRELEHLEGQLREMQGKGEAADGSAGSIARLKEDIAALKERWAVDPAMVDTHIDMWKHAVRTSPKKPQTLSEWVKAEGGIRDTDKDVQHMMGGRKEAGRLVDNKRGKSLDDATLGAWEAGFFGARSDRPTIREFLDLLDEDVRGGRVVREDDVEQLLDHDLAQEFRRDLEESGALGTESEARARRMITGWLREQTLMERAVRSDLMEDRARLADLEAQLRRAETDDERALIQGEIDKLRDQIGDVQAALSGLTAARGAEGEARFSRRKIVEGLLKAGKAYRVADDFVAEQIAEAARYAHAVPEGTRLGALSKIVPLGGGKATFTFRLQDGSDLSIDVVAADLLGTRAAYLRDGNSIVLTALGRPGAGRSLALPGVEGPGVVHGKKAVGVDQDINTGVYHEVVHARWRTLDPVVRDRLVAHAETLGVMDMQLGTFLRAIDDPTWKGATANETLREAYSKIYARRPDFQDIMAQEAVAHMQELAAVRFFSDMELEAVADDLALLRGGEDALDAAPAVGEPLFAIQGRADIASGQSMRRDLDALGYYSQALEAAKSWKQVKGSPAQALAHLKSSGVKDAEIEATGLKAFLEGKRSVTRDDLVVHLEESRVGLTEVRRDTLTHDPETGEPFEGPDLDEFGRPYNYANSSPKWSNYSLDPDNPTYRETVLHLPIRDLGLGWEAREAPGEWQVINRNTGEQNSRGLFGMSREDAESRATQLNQEVPFRSGHFDEPNIVGHMMTSMTTHRGRPVYTIDQIQSDWGQRIRKDGGARDEGRIADMEERLFQLRTALDDIYVPRDSYDSMTAQVPYPFARPLKDDAADRAIAIIREREGEDPLESYGFTDPKDYALKLVEEERLLAAELTTARTATQENHPLVNTTDQWVNTTLRRAIRQAAEADAEYIAIPSGKTVLSYNPGDEHGMEGFYDQIVPKNLRNILSKIDKATPGPERIDTLDSPSGKTGLGRGFTVFPLTDAVKRQVIDEGQPLFAIAGPRAADADLGARSTAQRLADRGRSMDEIFRTTGWFRGNDGFWRFEIDDSKAAWKDAAFTGRDDAGVPKAAPAVKSKRFWSWLTGRAAPSGGQDQSALLKKMPAWAKARDVRVARHMPLGEIIEHEELFKHYPFLRKHRANIVVGKSIPDDKLGGQISHRLEGNTRIFGPIRVIARDMDEAMNTLLHEVQHYIQVREGWPSGSAPKDLPRADAASSARPRVYSPNTEGGVSNRGGEGPHNWYREARARERLSARSEAESIVRRLKTTENDDVARLLNNDLRDALHIGRDAYRKDAGEVEANAVADRRTLTAEERRARLPVDSQQTFDTSKPMTLPEAAEVVAEREARIAAMEVEWAKPVEVTKGLQASRVAEDELSFRLDDGTEVFGVQMYPTVGGANLYITDEGLEALRGKPLAEQRRLVDEAMGYTSRRYNIGVSVEIGETVGEDFAFWHAVRPDLTVADVRSIFPTLEPHFEELFGKGTRLEAVDSGTAFYVIKPDGAYIGSWDEALPEWRHLVPEWSLAQTHAFERAPAGVDHDAWAARSFSAEREPLYALGGDGAPKAAPDRPEVSPDIRRLAKKIGEALGIEAPAGLRAKSFDDQIALLEAFLAKAETAAKKATKKVDNESDDLLKQIEELAKFVDADPKELQGIADETIDIITGMPVGRMINPFDNAFLEGKAGPLKARTLKIPDLYVSDAGHAFEDFLDDDIERIASSYIRSMMPDIGLTREFGDINMVETRRQIQEDASRRAMEVGDGPEAQRIKNEARKAENDLMAIAKRLRGTFNEQDNDPTAWGPWMARRAKEVNVLRLMGSVIAASISDPMKLLVSHGFRQNADLFSTLVTNFKGARFAMSEAKEMSAGLELVMSRAGQLWDAMDDFGGHSKFDRAMEGATRKFGRLTLMDQWNATLKQLSGVMTANRVLRASVELTNGRISKAQLTRLAKSGISADLAETIAEQYQKHGGMHGRLWLANVGAWDDTDMARRAASALKSAVRKEADTTIVTPGQERPLWTSGTYGSVIGQFRTFQMVTIQRTLIPAMQEANAAVIVGLAGMIGLGMLSERLKTIIHGKDGKDEPKHLGDWLYAGIANGGVLGWVSDVDQTLHKVTRGNISAARLLFRNERPISRYASQNVAGSLLGPTFGAGQDLMQAIGAASSREITQNDIRAVRRLMFYQNLFWLSRALRAGEDEMIDALGIPQSRRH